MPVQRSERPTDWPGIVLIAVALVSLQIILSRWPNPLTTGSVLRAFAALAWLGATALILFGVWQTSARNRAPLLRLELLRDRYVLSSALIGVLTE